MVMFETVQYLGIVRLLIVQEL